MLSIYSMAGNTDSTASISIAEVPVTKTIADGDIGTGITVTGGSAGVINIAAHGYVTGERIMYEVADGGTAIGGLESGKEYYIVEGADADKFSLATTFANATASPPVLIEFSAGADGDQTFTKNLDFASIGLTTDTSTNTIEDQGGDPTPNESVRYVSQIDIATRDSALLAMTVVDAALETINSNRAGLGAVANRLESTISNLLTTSENTSASLSRIMDADFATESTALARAQVLQQASVAMLAQANASTQTVLRLLE